MVQEGLAAVASPSELFLSARNQDSTNAASAAVAVTMEGSRPILLEVQVLSICYSTSIPPTDEAIKRVSSVMCVFFLLKKCEK